MKQSLEGQLIHGGMYMGLRQLLGSLLGLVGVVVLNRLIGPRSYGLYAAVFGIYAFLLELSQCGATAYLIQKEGEPDDKEYDQAFSLSCVLGLCITVSAILIIPLIKKWTRLEGFEQIALLMFLVLPVHLVSLIFVARLEKRLLFQKVALIEVLSQVTFYLTAIPLGAIGFGAWAPALGWIVQQMTTLSMLWKNARYRPRFCWDNSVARRIMAYGLSYSSANWIWQIRNLVNPLIIARYLGSESVAFVSLATRLVDGFSFIKFATRRVFFAGLGYIKKDKKRVTNAITEGMTIQIILTGPVLVLFCLAADWLVPHIFGYSWAPTVKVLPYVALSSITAGMSSFHSSALSAEDRNWYVASFNVFHVFIFVGSALAFVRIFGLTGYNFAELSALSSYGLLNYYTVRCIGKIDYGMAGFLWLGVCLSLIFHSFGLYSLIPCLVVLLFPTTLRKLKQYYSYSAGRKVYGS